MIVLYQVLIGVLIRHTISMKSLSCHSSGPVLTFVHQQIRYSPDSQQDGGEIAAFFIVPRNTDVITTLSGKAYLSALVLVLLLAMLEAEADFHAGDGYARKEVRLEVENEFRDTYSDLIC